MPGGLGVFVQGYPAVGDRVRAEVFKVKKNHVHARLLEVLEPSPHRVDPACPHFGVCGGCKWQHVDYAAQLRIKRKRVEDTLVHIGGFVAPAVADALPAPETLHYRNKMEFSFSRKRFLLERERDLGPAELDKPMDFALGFHAPRFYEKVVDIDQCFIATPDMNVALEVVKPFCRAHGCSIYSTQTHDGFLRNLAVRHAGATGELMVNLVTSDHDPALMIELRDALLAALGERLTTFVNNTTARKNTAAVGEQEYILHGPGTITETLCGRSFTISANSFFQTNTAQAARLYDLVLQQAGLERDSIVYDLYSGTGVIALLLAGSCARVLGFEVVDSAVEDARENARRNGVANCTFRRLDLKDFKKVGSELEAFGLPDVVVVDPPRAGLHPKVLQALLNLRPRRVVYVSCNPASLARDAAALCEQGPFVLGLVQPVDMFPHTNHIECVGCLEHTERVE